MQSKSNKLKWLNIVSCQIQLIYDECIILFKTSYIIQVIIFAIQSSVFISLNKFPKHIFIWTPNIKVSHLVSDYTWNMVTISTFCSWTTLLDNSQKPWPCQSEADLFAQKCCKCIISPLFFAYVRISVLIIIWALEPLCEITMTLSTDQQSHVRSPLTLFGRTLWNTSCFKEDAWIVQN